MTQQLWWYAVRASGSVAWILVTATVIWGLALSTRSVRRTRPAWVLDLHRFLGALTHAFLAIHVVGLLFDEWVGFGPSDLLVPMAREYRPGALAWGIVAMYLLFVVEVTSIAMRHLPRRVWHGIHLSSFLIFAMTTVHALTAGTDARRVPMQVFAWASSATVAAMTVFRVVVRFRATRRQRLLARRLATHDRRTLPVDTASLDAALDELRRDERRRRATARHGHHRSARPRGTPR